MQKTVQLLVCAVLAMTMGIASANAGSSPNGKPFVALNDQIVEVKGAITSLQDQVDGLVGRVNSIEERIAASELAITSLQNQNQVIQELITFNLTTVWDIQFKIDALTQENLDLRAMIDANSGDIEAQEAKIFENKGSIANLQSALLMTDEGSIVLDSLQTQIDNNSEVITAIQNQIYLLNKSLAEKQDLINGVCPDGSAVQQINADGSVVCGAAGGGVSGEFESVRVFVGQSAAPGGVVDFGLSCPDGYAATAAGVTSASGWDIFKLHTSPPDHPKYPNGGLLVATNKNNVPAHVTIVLTCMRLVP